jgi:Holliday junction resolvasome RuvABC ATP-dependent DNA helicase subunit
MEPIQDGPDLTMEEKAALLVQVVAERDRLTKRLERAKRLLKWVLDEADLSGQMELAAEIRAFLHE